MSASSSGQTKTCGENYTDVISGRITSPGHPYPYEPDLDCEWKVISSAGNQINLRIEHLNNREVVSGTNRW